MFEDRWHVNQSGRVIPAADRAVQLLQRHFFNRADPVAFQPPWDPKGACPAEGGGNLPSLLLAHVLGEQAPEVTIRWTSRKHPEGGERLGRWRIGSYLPSLD